MWSAVKDFTALPEGTGYRPKIQLFYMRPAGEKNKIILRNAQEVIALITND